MFVDKFARQRTICRWLRGADIAARIPLICIICYKCYTSIHIVKRKELGKVMTWHLDYWKASTISEVNIFDKGLLCLDFSLLEFIIYCAVSSILSRALILHALLAQKHLKRWTSIHINRFAETTSSRRKA